MTLSFKQLQQIANQINKKEAKPFRGSIAPGSTPVGSSFRQNPPSNNNVNSNVKNMQFAMQNLAQTISSTIDYNAVNQAMQNPNNPNESSDKFQAQYGKDMFSNFMVNNYLKKSNVKGVEYDLDSNKSNMLDKHPSDLKNMFVILDSLQRIGSQKKEDSPDGDWGPRTNNALQNVSAIAQALTQLGSQLGMRSNSISAKQINQLNALIPPDIKQLSLQEKSNRASKITPIINGIKNLFLDFKNQTLKNPVYQNYIEKQTPFMTFGPPKEKQIQQTSEEQPILQDLQQKGSQSRYVNHPATTFNINLHNIQVAPITAADLVNQEAFDRWTFRPDNKEIASIKQQNPVSWNNIAKNILDQVKSQAADKLSSKG